MLRAVPEPVHASPTVNWIVVPSALQVHFPTLRKSFPCRESDELDIFTWDTQVDFYNNGVYLSDLGAGNGDVDGAMVESSDGSVNTLGYFVKYVINPDFSGRVYVTGLSAAGAVGAVPEPESLALLLAGAFGLVGCRWRRN